MAESIAARIAKLERMTTSELRQEWRKVIGGVPTSFNRRFLYKRVAWAVQAKEYGGLSARAQARLEELLPYAEQWMPMGRRGLADPPPATATVSPTPGTVLTRTYKGRTVAVLVRDDGRFEWDGEIFESLTAVAKAVTGSHWNGNLFFGLRPARRRA
ncbi:MAG TPA: DUF2924 domain-containing protein [Acidimicrobiia bacterium]|nr:DUF2924 domain-containing protein [Acidimicrobiia bacterium]